MDSLISVITSVYSKILLHYFTYALLYNIENYRIKYCMIPLLNELYLARQGVSKINIKY